MGHIKFAYLCFCTFRDKEPPGALTLYVVGERGIERLKN